MDAETAAWIAALGQQLAAGLALLTALVVTGLIVLWVVMGDWWHEGTFGALAFLAGIVALWLLWFGG